MKTSISRDNIIDDAAEGNKFQIFKDDEADISERFVMVCSGWGSRQVIRLSGNEMKVINEFCKKEFGD